MPFMTAKSPMFLRKTVVFIADASEAPPAFSTAARFARDCLVCASTPSGIFPVFGSIGSCPETKTSRSAAVPCEYGPTAGAAADVLTMVLFMGRSFGLIAGLLFHDGGNNLSVVSLSRQIEMGGLDGGERGHQCNQSEERQIDGDKTIVSTSAAAPAVGPYSQ